MTSATAGSSSDARLGAACSDSPSDANGRTLTRPDPHRGDGDQLGPVDGLALQHERLAIAGAASSAAEIEQQFGAELRFVGDVRQAELNRGLPGQFAVECRHARQDRSGVSSGRTSLYLGSSGVLLKDS